MPILLTIRTLSIYVLSIILSISLFITLMINPSVQTKASSNTKEFMNLYSLELTSGTTLAEVYPTLETLLVKATKETKNNQSEYTIKLISEYENNKLILPLDITLEAGDSLESIQTKYQKSLQLLIQNLKESKSKETTILNSNITFDENSMQTQLDELTITNNLENNLLETDLQTNIQTKTLISSDQILVNKLEIITTDYDRINDKLDKLSKNEGINIQNTINQNDLKPIKTKIKKDSKQIKANTILKDYSTKKSNEEKRFKSASQKAKIDFDQAYQNNAPQSEIDKLIIKHQWTNIEIKAPTIREATEINTILNTLVESTQLTQSNLQIIQKDETKANKENLKKDKTSKQVKKQNFSNLKSIIKLKFKNSLYISKEQEAEDSKRFEADKKKEIEFQAQNYPNGGISNPANNNSSNSANSSNPTNSKTAQENQSKNTDNIFTQIANNLFGGSLNAEARGLNNSSVNQYIYNYEDDRFTLDVPYANANNGTRIKLGIRNGGRAQKFWAENKSQSIKSDLNTNLCLDASGDNVTYGTAIILWQCNGNNNQKWFFDGNLIRSWKDPKFCIDATGGNLNNEVPIQLWECDTNATGMRYTAGLDNFGAKFDVNINASDTVWPVINGNQGHVFISYYVDNKLVNTQSSWPNNDTVCDNNNAFLDVSRTYYSRKNNSCDGDSAWVDENQDIDYALFKSGTGKEFRVRSYNIPKKISDSYRYSSKYRLGGWDYGRANIDYTYGSLWFFSRNNGNCANFSQKVWNDIMDDNKSFSSRILEGWIADIPKAIYDRI